MNYGRNERPEAVSDATKVDYSSKGKRSLRQLLDNPEIEKMVESLLGMRLARIDNDAMGEWLKGNPMKTLDDIGYEYDPEHNEWGWNSMDDAKSSNTPWFATTREALDAIYNSIAGMEGVDRDEELEEFYGAATGKLKNLVDSRLDRLREARENDDTPTQDELDYLQKLREAKIIGNLVAEPLSIGNILRGDGMVNPTMVENPEGRDGVLPYQKPVGNAILDFLVPTRGAVASRDPEVTPTGLETPMDIAELGLTAGLPIGKAAGAGIRALAKAGKSVPVIGKLLNKGVTNNVFTQLLEGALGNAGNYALLKGTENMVDPENRMQTAPFSKEGLVTSAAIGAGIPTAYGLIKSKTPIFGKGKFSESLDNLKSGNDRLRDKMAEAHNANMHSTEEEIVPNDVSTSDVIELRGWPWKANTIQQFQNEPYSRMAREGYTEYSLPRTPNFDKSLSKDAGVQGDLYKSMLRDQLVGSGKGERAARFDKWATENADTELKKLAGGVYGVSEGLDNAPKVMNQREYASFIDGGNSPVPEFHRAFAVPTRKGEDVSKLGEKELERRSSMKYKADKESRRRRALSDGLVKNKNTTIRGAGKGEGSDKITKYAAFPLLRSLLNQTVERNTPDYEYVAPGKGE